jgi:hypothetical protein
MAKVVKKTKQTTKIEELEKTVEELKRKVAPGVPPGLVSIAMLPNDLATLTNLMSICAQAFEEQALQAAQANDEQKYAVLSARHKLSSMFADRFVEFCRMGEPESRDMH